VGQQHSIRFQGNAGYLQIEAGDCGIKQAD
jgi:hypothetical protein